MTARATVADVAPLFLEGAEAVSVVGDAGQVLGTVRRDAVVRMMLGG